MNEEPAQEPPPGDHRERMERLFREHYDDLIRVISARLHSYSVASEVAQEAYVRLLTMRRPASVDDLKKYLFRTASNLAIDRLRGAQTHTRATQLIHRHVIDERTPERVIAGRQELERFSKCLARLSPKCQMAFVMHVVQNIEFVEIARRMRLTESMVRKYVRQGLKQCRAAMNTEKKHAER